MQPLQSDPGLIHNMLPTNMGDLWQVSQTSLSLHFLICKLETIIGNYAGQFED